MSNPYSFNPDKLQLANPPYLSGSLMIIIPIEDLFVHSFSTCNIGSLVSNFEREAQNLETEIPVATVIDGLRDIKEENGLADRGDSLVVADYRPGPSHFINMTTNRYFDIYEAPVAPRESRKTFKQMFEVIMNGYERQYAKQEF